MKRALIIGIAVLALIVIVVASVAGGGSKGEKVYVEPVKARNIEAIVSAPGEINPKVKVNISANVIGKIVKLYFVEGQNVKQGQRMVDLERPAYAALRDRAAAEVVNRRIEVERAKSALGTADLAYRRAQNMRTQGIQAQELFDQAKLGYENAKAGYASAVQGVRQAEALLQQADNDLSHTIITSPIDGKVVQLNAHEGEVVITGTMNNPGSVIAVVADLSEILVEADVGETEVVAVRVGQKAKVHIDAVGDREYDGHVVEIGSSAGVRANSGSGMRYFKVKVQIDNPDDRLRPGMTSQVAIITSTAGSTPSVPIQSVVERVPPSLAKGKSEDELDENLPKRKYVFVAKDGSVKMVEVKTGVSDATHVAIVSGVRIGDQVVTGPFRVLKKLKDGDKVEITKEETSAKKPGETT
jgi:HlyD family secretion protein